MDGIAEELVLARLAHVLDPEKALVAGVLQQSADKISHAGEQLADGAVFAHAVPRLQQRELKFVRHAVKRLEFIRRRLDAESLGLRDRVRDRTHVVRGEVRSDDVDVLEQKHSELFVVGVGLGLLLPDGNGPVALLRNNRL
jgi:hypothetical protein